MCVALHVHVSEGIYVYACMHVYRPEINIRYHPLLFSNFATLEIRSLTLNFKLFAFTGLAGNEAQ